MKEHKDTEPHSEQRRDHFGDTGSFFFMIFRFHDIHLCILCTKVCSAQAADSLFRREGWQTRLDLCQVRCIISGVKKSPGVCSASDASETRGVAREAD